MTQIITNRDAILREIAENYGLTYEMASEHRKEVWRRIHGVGPTRLKPIMLAWDQLPGSFSYYDACVAMERALKR